MMRVVDVLLRLMKSENILINDFERNIFENIGVFSQQFNEGREIGSVTDHSLYVISTNDIINTLLSHDIDFALITGIDADTSPQIIIYYSHLISSFIVRCEYFIDEELELDEYVLTEYLAGHILKFFLDAGVRIYTSDTF